MAGKKMELGPTGEIVRDRVRQIRELRGYTYAELSRLLEEEGRPIPPLGLRRIEVGERRVDVDDLVALAVVLETSPLYLLQPGFVGYTVSTPYSGGDGEIGTYHLDAWLRGNEVAKPDTSVARFRETRPRRLESEEEFREGVRRAEEELERVSTGTNAMTDDDPYRKATATAIMLGARRRLEFRQKELDEWLDRGVEDAAGDAP